MKRYSSRRHKLDKQFLIEKLKNAVSYDRVAGYFCSSILEVAGESIENVEGKVRVICNSGLLPEDVAVANYAQKMKQEWCEFSPEEKYTSPESSNRLSTLPAYHIKHQLWLFMPFTIYITHNLIRWETKCIYQVKGFNRIDLHWSSSR